MMKISKLIALGLIVAGSAGCPQGNKDGAKAQGTNSATTASTAAQTAAQEDKKPEDAAALPFEATGNVATVNGKPVTKEAYNEEVERLVKMMGNQVPPQMLLNLKDQIVEQLVSKILVEDAIANAKIDVPQSEVDAEFQNFTKQLDASAPGGSKAYFEKLGRTPDEMKSDIKKSLQLKAMMAKEHDIKIPEAEVKKFYDENKAQFDQPARIQASHILLKLDKSADDAKVKEVEAKAKELATKAKAPGADFAALAKENSEGPTGPRGGDLGFFVKGQMVPEFDAVAWKLKEGEVSDPVRTQFGYHVIKLTGQKEANSMSFEEAKPLIEARLQEPKLKTAMKATLDKLKADAKIEKSLNNIKTNITAAPPSMPPGMGGMGGMGGHGGHPHAAPPGGAKPGAAPGAAPKKLQLDKLK